MIRSLLTTLAVLALAGCGVQQDQSKLAGHSAGGYSASKGCCEPSCSVPAAPANCPVFAVQKVEVCYCGPDVCRSCDYDRAQPLCNINGMCPDDARKTLEKLGNKYKSTEYPQVWATLRLGLQSPYPEVVKEAADEIGDAIRNDRNGAALCSDLVAFEVVAASNRFLYRAEGRDVRNANRQLAEAREAISKKCLVKEVDAERKAHWYRYTFPKVTPQAPTPAEAPQPAPPAEQPPQPDQNLPAPPAPTKAA